MNINFINWKSYYKDSQIEEYNLRNTYCINLFNTNDINMKGDYQLNYLNPYLGELPMMYYIWKNNLKSKYICISQYRRDITNIDYEKLDKDGIQLLYLWPENENVKLKDRLLKFRDPSGKIKEVLLNYCQKQFNLSEKELDNIKNKTFYECMACFVWAMNWNTYCKLCELIFGFLDELFPNEGWKNIDTLINFRDNQKQLYYQKFPDKEDWVFDNNRYMVYIMEDSLSVILNQFFYLFTDYSYTNQTMIYTEVSKENINDAILDIAKFYKLNLKCNPESVIVKCLDEDIYQECHKFFVEQCYWEFNKMKILSKDDPYYITEYFMKLDIREYIDLNEPIDLINNKYNIKKIQ